MKIIIAVFVGLVFIGLGGCALTESTVEDVGGQLQQGLTGRGQIVPDSPTSDSFGPLYR